MAEASNDTTAAVQRPETTSRDALAALTTEPYAGLHWQMTTWERFAFQDLLRRISPDVSVEVGTYMGGSLQVLSHFSRDVVSVDIDPSVPDRLQGLFHNVGFRTGRSSELLPAILRSFATDGRHVGFVLVDGDHSAAGVRRDIESVLSVQPTCQLVLLMHDAFNPECRTGIVSARWADCPYVHAVEVDFVPGIFHERDFDTAAARSMWGGFACAVLRPEPRANPLQILQSQRRLFDAAYAISSHRSATTFVSLRSVAAKIKRGLARLVR